MQVWDKTLCVFLLPCLIPVILCGCHHEPPTVPEVSQEEYDQALQAWNADGTTDHLISSRQYLDCAVVVVTNMRKYQNCEPTPANVLALLGSPSEYEKYRVGSLNKFLKYYGNHQTRTKDFVYRSRGISIGTSIFGHVTSVDINNSILILPDLSGPGQASDSMTTPIIHWPADQPDLLDSLLQSIDTALTSYDKESDWVSYIFETAPNSLEIPGIYDVPCKAEINLIEYHFSDHVAVYFQIHGKHEFYCETWWSYYSGSGHWEIDICRLGSEYFKDKVCRRLYKIDGSEEIIEGQK
ncbi:MAG: hypothetical protein JXA82_05270 [Sedimentisphaerales bacterium]|nr:hypothetical protein [Sedimentisphaerales bacterium]